MKAFYVTNFKKATEMSKCFYNCIYFGFTYTLLDSILWHLWYFFIAFYYLHQPISLPQSPQRKKNSFGTIRSQNRTSCVYV